MRCIFALSHSGGCGLSPSCCACGLRNVVDTCFAEGRHHHRVPVSLNIRDANETDGERRILVSAVPYEGGEERMVLVYLEDEFRSEG